MSSIAFCHISNIQEAEAANTGSLMRKLGKTNQYMGSLMKQKVDRYDKSWAWSKTLSFSNGSDVLYQYRHFDWIILLLICNTWVSNFVGTEIPVFQMLLVCLRDLYQKTVMYSQKRKHIHRLSGIKMCKQRKAAIRWTCLSSIPMVFYLIRFGYGAKFGWIMTTFKLKCHKRQPEKRDISNNHSHF